MRKLFLLGLIGCVASCSKPEEPTAQAEQSCLFPLVAAEHTHMQQLLTNAMSYINPAHGMIDNVSGYPVEGWNHDPSKGLYLRSFTQLTSIGEWVELQACIAAGYADNPYMSQAEALAGLELTVQSLLDDQTNPKVSAKGLLGNFLGLENGVRLGPLGEEVEKQAFVDAFGAEKANNIWVALTQRGWITPQREDTEGKIKRVGEYGSAYFSGALAPFSDEETKSKIMALLDERVVKIIFGDNVNLTSSVGKAVGALLHPKVKDMPKAVILREKMEKFITAQKGGYEHLFNPETDTFIFGWNASNDRFVGWSDGAGGWVVGHQNYFVNEFRGPFMFSLLRYDLPINSVKNSGMKIKPYRMQDGKDLYTLATWHGSSFQSLGLTTFMQEHSQPGWSQNMANCVDIELDFATRHGNAGFLTESYSGNGVEYTGDVGIPDIAVTDHQRITDAPSLYTLGVSYSIAPKKIESFLSSNWDVISQLFTDHGPWEGYNTSDKRVIEFQTSAHTMSLILGGIGSGHENMQRYLAHHGLEQKLADFNKPGEAINLLDSSVQIKSWTSSADPLEFAREPASIQIRGEKVHAGGITLTIPQEQGVSLSNGTLKIQYQASQPMEKAVLTLKRLPGLDIKPMVFENEIYTRFDVTTGEGNTIEIPIPGTPGFENTKELILVYGKDNEPVPVDLTITGFEFIPAQSR